MDDGLWLLLEGYDDPQLDMNNPKLSDEEKCIYLIRCVLSDGLERDFPFNHQNCSKVIIRQKVYFDRT
jgi:hypothetical protein